MTPYFILEHANAHGGSIETLLQTIDEFHDLKGSFGMKFQPFKYDKIALPNFRAFEIYKELFFTSDEWKKIINKASETKDVWIDVFDEYSCQIIEENIDLIRGVKFQSSILYNSVVISLLSQLEFNGKKVIINISGIDIKALDEILNRFKQELAPEEIILQIGFQAYPTELADSGLAKIKVLREKYPQYQISFADHIGADELEAIYTPSVAFSLGAKYIEKHICKAGEKAKYDHFSSLTRKGINSVLKSLSLIEQSLSNEFINKREADYLKKSIQIPVLNKDLKAGKVISTDDDLNFRRSGEPGLRADELIDLIHNQHYILAVDKKEGETIKMEDLRKPVIGIIIGGRLKSKRLPKKLLLKIGELTAVETCIRGALRCKEVNHVILATSTLEEDAELENYTYGGRAKFIKGDPDDLLDRFITTIDAFNLDIVVRATADCPYLSDEIFEYNLNAHFKRGADVTKAKEFAVGTTMSVTNAESYRRLKKYFPSPKMSEYLIFYFTNNPNHFKIQESNLPKSLIRDYRLTLDYQEDLTFMIKIEEYLNTNGLEPSVSNIFEFLDKCPDVADLNKMHTLVYETNKELIKEITEDSTIRL